MRTYSPLHWGTRKYISFDYLQVIRPRKGKSANLGFSMMKPGAFYHARIIVSVSAQVIYVARRHSRMTWVNMR